MGEQDFPLQQLPAACTSSLSFIRPHATYAGWIAGYIGDLSPPNQRFLVIRSLKLPSRLTSITFAGPIIRFLHITRPRNQPEGCWPEKKGPFPAEHPGRGTESVSIMAHPLKLTIVHLKVWLLLPHYGDTSALPTEWFEGVLLWDTLLEHPDQGIQVKTIPPNCRDPSELP